MNTGKPKISILLPTHNRADVISCAIESVLYQTYQDFELLIVGDGCTEETKHAISLFSDSRLKFFDLSKAAGFGYANRNIVLSQAEGEYISYMSDDDLWFPDHLEICIKAFDDQSIDWIYTKPLWVSPEALVFPIAFNLHAPSIFHLFVNRHSSAIAAATVMHRANCIHQVGYWDESLPKNADWDFWIKVLNIRPNNFAFIRESSALHFHAVWKRKDQIPDQYQVWKSFYSRLENDFPAQLHPEILGKQPEQHIFWHQFKYDSLEYAESLRRAVGIVESLHLSSQSTT